MSAFKKMVRHLQSQGHSEESATRIAAYIGRKKYGAHEMAERAAESRHKHAIHKHGKHATEKFSK